MKIPMHIPMTIDTAAAKARPAAGRGKRKEGATPTPAPFSLRLTFEERAALESAAGDQPLGSYIRYRLLGEDEQQPRRRRRAPVRDQEALARLMGELGQSRLASNLNQLARAANTGSLPVTPDTERAIRQACYDVQRMRVELLRALGIMPGNEP